MGKKKFDKLFTVLCVLAITAMGWAATAAPVYQPIPSDPNAILASGVSDLTGTAGIAHVEYWVWNGGNGYYYYTYQIHNATFSPYIKHLLIGNPTKELYIVTGSSGGGNTGGTAWVPSLYDTRDSEVHWMAVSSTTLVYPGTSSWDSPLFQFASQLPPASASISVREGSVLTYANGLICSPGRPSTPRSSGYWAHQYANKGKPKEADMLGTYMNAIKACSLVFGTSLTGVEPVDMAYAIGVLEPADNSDMRAKAKRQLFALWLNIVSGKHNYNASYTFDPIAVTTTATTIGGAVQQIEATILNTAATLEELENVKDMAEILDCL